ncbi:MAG: very short patch repair endonuclease [Bacteroidales bacterium]|nr:very short patch repair endonuclease [Bacteroidales bacterium]
MTPEQRFVCMSHNKAKNTTPEISLRHALWHRCFRYRMNDKRLPGKPDIVLPKYRTVVFIHGCFWHGHKNCKYYTVPKTNTEFWTAKVARNQARDQKVWRELEAAGWSVIIVWECELKKAKFQDTINRVEAEIKAAGEKHQQLLNDRKAERARVRKEREARLEKQSAVEAKIGKRINAHSGN